MITWIFKKKDSSISGITCSVLSIYGIKYPKIVELLGEPHTFEETDNENNPIKAKWLFVMYNGDKAEFRFDRDENTLRKMEHEGLKRGKRGSMEDCNFFTIMGNTDSTIIIATLLQHFFPDAEISGRREIGDKHYVIKSIMK
jgi:hypothetical protein